MRGHGRSDGPAPPYHWPDFARDVAAAARALELDDALAVGHSKGGYAIALSAARDPGPFGRLLLIDPVILPRERYGTSYGQEHFAARRRNTWASPDEMFERFKDREPFSRWDPAVLRDYCDYGLLPNTDGEGYVLACPPAIEAATYAGSAAGGEIYDALPNLHIPVRILRARNGGEQAPGEPMDMSRSPTAPDIASAFPDAEDVYLPQYSHFIPMEDPGFVAAQVRELLDR
jgi:pimeloyl-ACP methyl ester carboxylesterase